MLMRSGLGKFRQWADSCTSFTYFVQSVSTTMYLPLLKGIWTTMYTALVRLDDFSYRQLMFSKKNPAEDTTKSPGLLFWVSYTFMTSRLDYCNALMGGCPAHITNKLQLVQNAAARVLTRARKYDHISPVLSTLHWLPMKHCIHF